MNKFNVGEWVQYESEIVLIVDHYGNGVYCIEIYGEWKSVNENELKVIIVWLITLQRLAKVKLKSETLFFLKLALQDEKDREKVEK